MVLPLAGLHPEDPAACSRPDVWVGCKPCVLSRAALQGQVDLGAAPLSSRTLVGRWPCVLSRAALQGQLDRGA